MHCQDRVALRGKNDLQNQEDLKTLEMDGDKTSPPKRSIKGFLVVKVVSIKHVCLLQLTSS